jgi:hypothetical protein
MPSQGRDGGTWSSWEIPPETDRTFYWFITDPFVAPDPRNMDIDGDRNMSAFHFHDSRVDIEI